VETTVFKTLSYRVGYFEDKEGHRIGTTHGIGLILGPVRFDIAEDGEIYEFFTGPNWRVQTTLTSTNSSLKIPENNPAIALFLSLFMPGGGQFYNNQEWKGCLVFTTGLYLAHNYYHFKITWSKIGLGSLYLLSALDALYFALK